MEEPDRLVPLHVAQLTVAVAGYQEHAMLLPLKNFLWAVASPNRGQSSSLKHINDLVRRHPVGRKSLPGPDLHDIGARHSFLARELHKGGVAFSLFPSAKLQGPQIFHVVALVYR